MPRTLPGSAVLRLEANHRGRDFIIGDLHGCLAAVADALRAVEFQASADRLFCCGDLVDRGEDSEAVVALVDEPWFYSVRGNHDQAAIDHLGASGETPRLPLNEDNQWLRDLCIRAPDRARQVGDRLAALPLAITLEGRHARIGIVHAGVPIGLSWPGLMRSLDQGDPDAVEAILWTRPIGLHAPPRATPGVDRIYAGHTPLLRPRQQGNVWYIDGGGVYRMARARRSLISRQVRGGWNVARLDTTSESLESPPRDCGMLRVYGNLDA